MAKKLKKIQLPVESVDVAPIETTKEITMATNKLPESNGRNALPAFDPGLVTRTVENAYPFTLEFDVNSIVVRVVTDDKKSAPYLIGKDEEGRTHSVLNATTAIWNGHFPVFEEGYMYLHTSLYEAEQSLGNKNVGYVIGGERLINDIDASIFAKPPMPIKAKTLYRIHWDNNNFSLWEVKNLPAKADEPTWVKHDRRAIMLVKGLETIYKAIRLGQSIRLYIYPEVEALAAHKVKQYNFVLEGNFDALKIDVRDGNNKVEQYDEYKRLQVQPEVVARAIELHGTQIRIVGNGAVDANSLIGHRIQYYLGANLPIPGQYEVTEQNVGIVVSMCHMKGYSVALV